MPDKDSFGAAPQLVSSRPIVTPDLSAPAKAMEGFGQEVTKAAGSVIQNDQIQQHQKGEYDALKAETYFNNGDAPMVGNYKDDSDFKTSPDRYKVDATARKDQALALISNPLYKAKADKELSNKINSNYTEIRNNADTVYRRVGAQDATDTYNDSFQAAQNAPDEASLNAILEQNRLNSHSAVNNKYFQATHAAALNERLAAAGAKSLLGRKADADPEGALAEVSASLAPVGKTATASTPTTATPSFSPEVNTAIDTAAKDNNVPADYLYRTANIESKGNPTAQSNKASSGGLFQFTNSTAKQYGLDDKYDATKSADAAAKLYTDNKSALASSLGREPTDAEVYLAHQQGSGGAAALLQKPDENAIRALTNSGMSLKNAKDAVLNNGGSADMKAGDFAAKWTDKYDGSTPGTSGKTGSYLDNIPVPDRIQWKAKLEKTILVKQNETQVANVQNTADLFNKVSDGTMDLSDVLASNLSDEQKKQAQTLLLGGVESKGAAENLVGTARIPKGEQIQGLTNLDIQQDIDKVGYTFNDPDNAEKIADPKFFSERMQDYNNIMAKMNLARALNQQNPGKGLSNPEYKTLMAKMKSESQNMIDAVKDPGMGSSIGRWLGNNDTGFQILNDKIQSLYPGDREGQSRMLGYAYTLAQQSGPNGQPLDLFTPAKSQADAEKNMQGIIDKVTAARKAQVGVPSTAPTTNKAITGSDMHVITIGTSDAKPSATISPAVAPSKAPDGLPKGASFAKYIKGKPYYKLSNGKFWTE